MDKATQKKIEKDLRRLEELKEAIDFYEKEISRCNEEIRPIKSRLYENRPKSVCEELFNLLKRKETEYRALLPHAYADLIMDLEHWLVSYDGFIKDRLEYSTKEERAMLEGKLDPYDSIEEEEDVWGLEKKSTRQEGEA